MTADAVHRAGLGLMSASGLALAALIGERAAGLGWPWWIYAIAIGSGVLLGALSAVMVPPRRFDMAVKLDRTLGLRDRIASAEIVRHDASRAGVFGPLVEQDAQRVAQRVDVRAATPIRITRVWFGAAGAALLLVIGMALMPTVDWSSQSSDTTTPVAMHTPGTVQQQELIAQEIERAVAGVDTEEPLDPDLQQELNRLNELAEQLSADTATPAELSAVRDDAAATLNDVADRIANDAQRDLEATEAVAERFSGLEAAEAPMTAQEFAQALRNGEFGDAASLFEDLMRDAESLAPAEREALADGLRDLGDQLTQPTEPTVDDAPDDLEALRSALQDLGLDDRQIDELLNEEASRAEIEELLRQHDLEDDIARDLTDDVRDAAEQQAADRQAEQTAHDLSDAIDRAADEIDPTPPAEQPQTPDEQTPDQPDSDPAQTQRPQAESVSPDNDGQGEQPGAEQPGAANEGSEEAMDQREATGDEQRQSGDDQTGEPGDQQQQPSRERTGEPGEEEQQQQRPGGERTGKTGEEQQSESEQPGSGNERQQRQPGGEQTGAPPDTEQLSDPPLDPTGAPPDPGQPDPANPGNRGDQGDPGDPGDPTERAPQPSEGSPIDPGDGATQPGAPESGDRQPTVEELLDELNKRQRQGRDRARDSEEIREAARRIAEQMTDQEKRELAERWMLSPDEEDAPGSSSEGINRRDPDSGDRPFTETEQVDLRGNDDEPGQHTIAEWIDDEPAEGDRRRTTRSSKIARSAQTAAERAVDEAVVPRRYHELIQRYFQRIPETIEKAATTTNGGANTSGSPAQSPKGASQTTDNDS